jgi:hypothetical protein
MRYILQNLEKELMLSNNTRTESSSSVSNPALSRHPDPLPFWVLLEMLRDLSPGKCFGAYLKMCFIKIPGKELRLDAFFCPYRSLFDRVQEQQITQMFYVLRSDRKVRKAWKERRGRIICL